MTFLEQLVANSGEPVVISKDINDNFVVCMAKCDVYNNPGALGICGRGKTVEQAAKDYIQQKRLKYARDLLSQTDKSIEEIAECASFANRYHFSHAFKKNYLFSPGEYKRKYGLKKGSK